MPDIDMIPRSYHAGVRLQRQLRYYGVALAAVALMGTGAAALLHWRAAVQEAALVTLRRDTAAAQAAAARVQTANARLTALQQNAAVLNALRGAGDVARLADAFDATMPPPVWLRQLRLVRDAQAVTAPPPTPQADDLIVPGAAAGAPAQTWHVATSVQLRGQAADYTALAGFLRALGQQPVLRELRLGASSAALNGAAIDFDAGAAVRHAPAVAP